MKAATIGIRALADLSVWLKDRQHTSSEQVCQQVYDCVKITCATSSIHLHQKHIDIKCGHLHQKHVDIKCGHLHHVYVDTK
jgi:hypothetical protein